MPYSGHVLVRWKLLLYRNAFDEETKDKMFVYIWKEKIDTQILTNFYGFRFKGTATAAIGIHPTKA